MREFSGWIRDWRQATYEDLYLFEPHTFKLWRTLLILAQHTKFRDLEPGDVATTYEELRDLLRTKNGKTYSQHTIQECLLELANAGYIRILAARRGIGLRIRILRWNEMQGQLPEGHEFVRFEYPPASSDFMQ